MYLINVLDDSGHFEMIDSELLDLYPNLNRESLITINDKQYQEFCDKNNGNTKFINGEFVFENAKADLTALRVLHRQEMWEKIKQKRHDNLRAGCFVKSVGKWFHTNDESRQQYIFMRTLPELPDNLMWKTMDNSFVKVNKSLLDELSTQMLLDEQADFANAERHKAQMERAENPLEYDYSAGWSNTYAD